MPLPPVAFYSIYEISARWGCPAADIAGWAAAGHPVVSFAGQPPLELPLPDWAKIDAEPEDEIMTEVRATRRKLMAEREAALCVVREEPPEK